MSASTKQNDMCHKILTLQVATLQEVTEHYSQTLLEFFKKVQSDVQSLDVQENNFHQQFEHTYGLVQQVILYIISKTTEFKGAITTGKENTAPCKSTSDCNSQPAVKLAEREHQTEEKTSGLVMIKMESLEKNLLCIQKKNKDFEDKQKALENALQVLKCQQEEINKQVDLSVNKKEESSNELHTVLKDLIVHFNNHQIKIQTLEQEMKLATSAIGELTPQLSSKNNFENDVMKSIETLSKAIERSDGYFESLSKNIKKLEDEFETLSCKLPDRHENSSTLTAEKVKTLEKRYGMLCQLVCKRLSTLDKLKNEFGKSLKLRDCNALKIDDMEEKIKEISRDVEIIDLKSWEPVLGFSVFAELNLPPHSDFITDFKRQCSLQGVTLDESNGLYPISVSGFYCISASIRYECKGFNTVLCYTTKENEDETQAAECKSLFQLQGDESVTYFTDLSNGVLMHLELQDNVKHTHVRIRFSCALIKRYN